MQGHHTRFQAVSSLAKMALSTSEDQPCIDPILFDAISRSTSSNNLLETIHSLEVAQRDSVVHCRSVQEQRHHYKSGQRNTKFSTFHPSFRIDLSIQASPFGSCYFHHPTQTSSKDAFVVCLTIDSKQLDNRGVENHKVRYEVQ